ncbi:uncharacterized protein LOC143956349 [Lithobates pipiens]
MEANCSNLTERILRLTLEIIYLLTGENNIVAKKIPGDEQNPITVPLDSLLFPEINNEEKILQVTQKITDLLAGEGGNSSNFNVRIKENIKEGEAKDGVVKEKECLEGQKDLNKEVVMEKQPPLTSPGGSSIKTPQKRRPRPRKSRKSTQKDHTVPPHDQDEVMGIKIVIKEEEEMYLIDDQLSRNEDEMMETTTKGESSVNGSTGGHRSWNTPEGRLILSENCNKEDLGMALFSSHHKFNSSNCEQLFRIKDNKLIPVFEDKPYSCSQCEKSFLRKSGLVQHQRIHTGKKPFPCPVCGKCFIDKSQLNRHNIVHTKARPFPCPQCGKGFPHKGNRDKHIRVHTGEKPFVCSECDKSFTQKASLIIHQKMHVT